VTIILIELSKVADKNAGTNAPASSIFIEDGDGEYRFQFSGDGILFRS